jgi:hypothetical protein
MEMEMKEGRGERKMDTEKKRQKDLKRGHLDRGIMKMALQAFIVV